MTERLTDEQLSELLTKEAAATPGPWHAGRSDMTSYDGGSGEPFKNVYSDDERGGYHSRTGERLPFVVGRGEGDPHENAAFIAAARNNLRPLVEELIELRSVAERCAELLAERIRKESGL